jgi:hypothetical protein
MAQRTAIAVASVAAALLLPAAAQAGTVAVSNDAGQPVQLAEGSPVQIRHMAPVVTPSLAASDKRYTLVVTGPDGKSAGVDTTCVGADGAGPQTISYAGNGTYAVRFVTYEGQDDIYCEGAATTQNLSLVIAASVSLTGPSSPLLYREPGGGTRDLTFTYDLNPGAAAYQFDWAYDAKFGANGAIVGDYAKNNYGERFDGGPSGTLDNLNFPHAGTVSVVAAAQTIVGASSPFSAPVTLKLMGPFDWSGTPGITGGSGKTHVIGGEVYEPGVIGQKVSVLLAKGTKKFKSFTTKTIPSSRKLSFKIKKPRGKYRLKYVFKGADLVQAGAWTQKLTIGKGSSASVGKIVRAAG